MLKRYLFLLPVVALVYLSSCGKGGADTGAAHVKASLLVGTWALQRQNIVLTVNGVKHPDSVITTSDTSINEVRFTGDGRFAAISEAILGSGTGFVRDSLSGTYTVTASLFTTSVPVGGFASGGFYGTTTTGVPVFSGYTHSESITQLTSTQLNIHSVVSYTSTLNAVATTYNTVADNYYNKIQ